MVQSFAKVESCRNWSFSSPLQEGVDSISIFVTPMRSQSTLTTLVTTVFDAVVLVVKPDHIGILFTMEVWLAL